MQKLKKIIEDKVIKDHDLIYKLYFKNNKIFIKRFNYKIINIFKKIE